MAPVRVLKGSWSPCGIGFGLAKASFAPLTYKQTLEPQNETDEVEELIHAHQVPLEVGDEVYAVEVFRPRTLQPEDALEQRWYRGYVVSTSVHSQVPFGTDPSPQDAALAQEPQVSFGIFPAHCVYIREQLDENDERMAEIAAHREKVTTETRRPRSRGPSRTGLPGRMDPLHEEDEDEEEDGQGEDEASSSNNAQQIKINIIPYGSPSKSKNRASIGSISSLGKASGLSTSALKPPPELFENRPNPPLPNLKCGDETTHGAREPLIDEIACALREWATLLGSYLHRRDYSLFAETKERIEILHSGRRKLISCKLEKGEEESLKAELVECLAQGNIAQGLDIIVRHPVTGDLVSSEVETLGDSATWLSIVRLYATQACLAYGTALPPLNHSSNIGSRVEPIESSSPFSSSASSSTSINCRFNHVLVDFHGLAANLASPGEVVELYLSLFNQSENRFATEESCLTLDHNGVPVKPDAIPRLGTVFTDLSQHDLQDQLYLVCRIVRNGSFVRSTDSSTVAQTPPLAHRHTFMSSSPGPRSESASIPETASLISFKGNELERVRRSHEMLLIDSAARTSCRRPFGCAVLAVSQSNSKQAHSSSAEQHMPIFVPVDESAFSTLHEDIIASRTKDFRKDPKADYLTVGVRILQGEDRRLAPNWSSDLIVANRLGFPDVVFPDVHRNEVFIKLWSGEFVNHSAVSATSTTRSLASLAAASTGTSKDVEISVELRHRDGQLQEGALSRGAGQPTVSRFTSLVFHSNSNPTWGELVKVVIPPGQDSHLYFTFRNRSSASASRDPEQPFAFAYFPLFTPEAAFQSDGAHSLVLYRWDRSVSGPAFYLQGLATRKPDRDLLPIPPAMAHTLVPLQDSFTIRSFLVSTYHTQNETLLRLLRWKTELLQHPELTRETLSSLPFCSEVEICKFLRDILDALFGLLAADTNLTTIVFQSIVAILGFVSDRRFTNFKPVLKVYIVEHFAESSAGLHLLRSLNQLLRHPGDAETAPLLRSSIKVWKWLFELVIRSKELEGAEGESLATFDEEISSFLSSLKALMRANSPSSIIGTQTLVVQHFSSIVPSLAASMKAEDLMEEIISFIDSMGTVKGKMVVWRLLLFNQLVSSPVLATSSIRSLLVPNIVRWLKPSLGKFEEQIICKPNDPQAIRDNARVSWMEGIRLSVGVIALMLDKLQEALANPGVADSRNLLAQEHDNLEFLLGLLPRLFESYRELQSVTNLAAVERQRSQASVPSTTPNLFPSAYPLSLLSYSANFVRAQAQGLGLSAVPDSVESWPTLQGGVGEIGAVFVALVRLSPRKIFVNWLESTLEIEGKDTFARQLGHMCRVAQSIIQEEAFPSEWLNMTSLAHRAVMQVVESVAHILKEHFLPETSAASSFNTALWKDYFLLLLKLLASPQLLIEEFSPQKRRTVWRLTGDIRAEGARVLSRLWNAIASPQDDKPIRYGNYQIHFVSAFLDDVLTLCMSRHDELRGTAVEVLYSMILSEYHSNSPPQFAVIEKEVIDRFDRLFGVDTKGDELSRASFVDQLSQLFESSEMVNDLREQVDNFISSINSFLDLLLNVRSLPEGEEYQEDRIISTLKLMSFIREIGRSEIFVRYVNRLVTYHIALGNETEAGLTLKLHADLHTWNPNRFVDAVPELDLPRQTEFARKETLYLRILDHLGKGKAWESAIALSKELQHEYETKTFNYPRLSELLSLQAELYSGIATSDRHFGNYFRVAFYGQWPSSVAGKQYVYRGHSPETRGEFVDRMLNKHSKAQLLNQNSIPEDEIRFGETRYLQITPIEPELDQSSAIFCNPSLPLYVRRYYQDNEINTFSFTSTLSNVANPKDPSTYWTEKTVLICEESFPTILRRSEIVEIRLIEISPIENALQDVKTKEDSLIDLERRYAALRDHASNPRDIDSNALSMALNDVVDPPTDRGVPHYRQIFLNDDFVASVPSAQVPIIRQLESTIDSFVITVARCLGLHASICPREMQSFHETLERFFERSFSEELARLPSEIWSPAVFHPDEATSTEPPFDLAQDSHLPSRNPTSQRPKLGTVSDASLNGNGLASTEGNRRSSGLSQRPQSPIKNRVSVYTETQGRSGKENGSLPSPDTAIAEEASRTAVTNAKRSSIFSTFGKKKGFGKRKGSVSVLAEE